MAAQLIDRNTYISTDGHGSGIVLEKVAEYFYFAEVNKDKQGVADMDIPPELCLELLVAADYLDSKWSYLKSGGIRLTLVNSLNGSHFEPTFHGIIRRIKQ